MLIAHRGIHDNVEVPENSLMAFKKATQLNIAIELDIQLTKDLEVVVFHDNNLKRMTGTNKNVDELTFEEIRKLKLLNSNEIIPTLKEVLNLINGQVLIDIEIKDTKRIKDITRKLLELLNNYKGEVIIKSFNPKIIRKLRKIEPKYTYGLLISKKYKSKIYSFLMKTNIILLYSKPNFLAIFKDLSKTKKYIKLRSKYPIYIWTIKSDNELTKYDGYCDYYICNNLPY